MTDNRMFTQICSVVRDVRLANANWAKGLGVPEEKVETIFPDRILHYTDGKATEYKDCQIAKYQLDNFVLELLQPSQTPSPWAAFLENMGKAFYKRGCDIQNLHPAVAGWQTRAGH